MRHDHLCKPYTNRTPRFSRKECAGIPSPYITSNWYCWNNGHLPEISWCAFITVAKYPATELDNEILFWMHALSLWIKERSTCKYVPKERGATSRLNRKRRKESLQSSLFLLIVVSSQNENKNVFTSVDTSSEKYRKIMKSKYIRNANYFRMTFLFPILNSQLK